MSVCGWADCLGWNLEHLNTRFFHKFLLPIGVGDWRADGIIQVCKEGDWVLCKLTAEINCSFPAFPQISSFHRKYSMTRFIQASKHCSGPKKRWNKDTLKALMKSCGIDFEIHTLLPAALTSVVRSPLPRWLWSIQESRRQHDGLLL